MLYKPGDKVIIRSDLVPDNEYAMKSQAICYTDIFVSQMLPMRGKIATIEKVYCFGYRIKEFDFLWTDDMFEGSVLTEDRNTLTENERKQLLNQILL